MSELIAKTTPFNSRWRLMTTACALALLASLEGTSRAIADDASDPSVWIEVGGQLERIGGTGDRFIAPFMAITPTPEPYKFASPIDAVRPPGYAAGEEVKITFEPKDTNWVFEAGLRYGRSNGKKTEAHNTFIVAGSVCIFGSCIPEVPQGPWFTGDQFAKTISKHNESHLVLDFMAGKDVGLGMFGKSSDAVVSAGVRFAQFQAKSDIKVYAQPNVHFYNGAAYPSPGKYLPAYNFNAYRMVANSERNFRGVGPSLSIAASTPLFGNPNGAEFELDWGANAAVLFGRQYTKTSHYTTASHAHFNKYTSFTPSHTVLYPPQHHASLRSRNVTVPNIGGFAAISLKFPNAKVSLGYRGDFFFGANDAGIDVRKEDTLSFHGPYATISIGLGG